MPDRLFSRRMTRWAMLSLCLVGLLSLLSASSTALAWQEKTQPVPPTADPTADKTATPDAGKGAGGEPKAADTADGGTADPKAGSESGGSGGGVSRESYLVRFMKALGWFFGLIFLGISFTLVALIMMNVLQIRRDTLLPPDFIDDFEQRLKGKDYQGAYETARSDESMVARVLTAGLSKLNRGYPEAIEGMQEVGEDENMAMEHRLSYLALIGSIAPMIGLSGTVTGMILSFDKIASSATQPEPSELAEGISTALWTTLVGLGIAIPAMIAYNILRNRVARLVLEVGMVSEGLMGRFQSLGRSKPASGGGAAAEPAPAAPQE